MPAGPTWAAVFDWGEETPTIVDWGVSFPDHPALGNTTILHWRIRPQLIVSFPNKPGVQQLWDPYDWNMVLLDEPGPKYPEDRNDVIPGWHYHWGTGTLDGRGRRAPPTREVGQTLASSAARR